MSTIGKTGGGHGKRKVVGTPPGKGECSTRVRGNRMLWGRWKTGMAEEDVVGKECKKSWSWWGVPSFSGEDDC